MPFAIQIKLAQAEMLVQQNIDCEMTLTNLDRARADALHPSRNPWRLTFRVTHVKTGIEVLFTPDRDPFDKDTLVSFQPKQVDTVTVPLLMKMGFAAPGEYEISALWVFGAGKPAESNAVRIKVMPFTPRNLALFRADYPAFTGTVLNVAVDPPMLMRARMCLLPGRGFDRLDPIAEVNLRTTAVASEGPNQSIVPGDWIAWLDGAKIDSAHVDITGLVTEVKSAPLPAGDCQIVAPLYSATPPDDGSRPSGAALVLVTNTDKASLQVYNLTPASITAGAKGNLPTVPVWIESRALSNGHRYFVYCTSEGEKLNLYSSPWPGERDYLNGPTLLAEWPASDFVGGTFIADADDRFKGGLLIRKTVGPRKVLEFIDWQALPTGKYQELTRRPIDYDSEAVITRAVVRVFQSGFFAVLVKSNAGRWTLWDPIHGPNRLAPPLDMTPLPLDFSMIKSDEPILISGAIETGIKFLRADSSALKFKPT